MIQPILEVTPTFQPVWDEFRREWQSDAEGLPMYLVLADLARHIAKLLSEGANSELQQIFAVIEQWHLEGDTYVKEAATIGMLEDLQNTNVVGEGAPVELEKFLGPESRRWWVKVENFWSKGEPICDG